MVLLLTALWTLFVLLALAAGLKWVALPRFRAGQPLKSKRLGAIIMTVVALIWVIYRSTLPPLSWTLIRPLGGGWIVLFVAPVIIVTVAYFLRFTLIAVWVAWISLGAAVLLPIFDIFTLPFWTKWTTYPIEGWAMILVLFIIGWLFLNWFGKAAGWVVIGLAIAMILMWVQTLYGGTEPPALPSPAPTTSTTSAAPTPSPSPAIVSESPSTSPSPSPTVTSSANKALTSPKGKVVGWDQIVSLVNSQGNSWFIDEVNASKEATGYDWATIQEMADAKLSNGKLVDARRVVVFGATSDITEPQARKLADVAKGMPIMPIAAACYKPFGKSEVCPTGNDRVVTILTPFGVQSGKFGRFQYGSGVAMIPQPGGTVEYVLVTYSM